MVFPFFHFTNPYSSQWSEVLRGCKEERNCSTISSLFFKNSIPPFFIIFPPLTINTTLIIQASSLPLSFLSHFIPYTPTFILTPPLSSETQLRKAKGGVQGRHALNHIYKDLVSIVITQSTDKGRVMGEVCVCVSVSARVDWSVHICVYPYGKKKKGIIFSLAQGPVRVHEQMCTCPFLKVSWSS